MQPQTVTLIVAGIGIGGTLGGVAAGHFLTRSWQRKQWLLDRRKDEFRELMDTLVESFGKYANPRLKFEGMTQEDVYHVGEASALCYQTMCNRIYIAHDVQRMGLIAQWSAAIDEYTRTREALVFGDALRRMTTQVVQVAMKDV
jgi:hypothetical protein